MQSSRFIPYVVVLATLLAGTAALIWAVDIRYVDSSPVLLDLPAQVAEWEGVEILYCTAKGQEHRRSFRASELDGSKVCPECGSELATASPSELEELPGDTIMRRKQYTNPEGRVLSASIVLSGKQRSSLHRPQVCLTDGGNEIVGEHLIVLPTDKGKNLRVKVLSLNQPVQLPSGAKGQHTAFYAYWFAGHRHETPHHAERMILMAADKVLYRTVHRWAYVSISGPRNPRSNQEHLDIVRDFLTDFHPIIQAGGA